MKDFVLRDDVIEVLNSEGYTKNMRVHKKILAIPFADVAEIRHGHWIGTEYDGYADGHPVYDWFECSECRFEIRAEEVDNFCPSCGAKMDEAADEVEDE